MAEESGGFLGRWSSRKTDVLKGKLLVEPAAVAKPVALDADAAPVQAPGQAEARPALTPSTGATQEPQQENVLSLDDVKLLTPDSDFKPFMANNVGAEVRNAAMKKLFADPHFNVMDGLDIYIGDYSQPDPIAPSMLRQMVGAKFLNLFDDEEKTGAEDQAEAGKQSSPASSSRENPHDPNTEVVAQSSDRLLEPDGAAGQPESGPTVGQGDRGAS
jgi:hypothetical protein